MIGEVESPIIEIEAQAPLPLGVAIILTEPFSLALRSRREIALPTCLLKKAGM